MTKHDYQPIPNSLLPVIEAARGFTGVWQNGDMYGNLNHDSKWLTTCKAALDGIRSLPAPAASTGEPARTGSTGEPPRRVQEPIQ